MKLKLSNRIFRALIILILLFYPLSKGNSNFSNEVLFTSDDTLKSLRYLSTEISKIISDPALNNTKFQVAVYSIDNKKYYFKKNIDEYLTPASVTKLFTTFSALYLLSPDYNVKTQVYYAGEIKNGVLYGDLYLVGKGDVLLKSTDVEILAKKIKNYGITKINGNIYGDGSFFDDLTNRIDYSGDREVVQATPPITGLSIESNVVTIHVSGTSSSRVADVTTIPPSTGFKIVNSTKTNGGSRYEDKSPVRKKKVYLKHKGKYSSNLHEINDIGGPVRFAPVRDNKAGIKVSQKLDADGNQVFIVTGSIESGNNYKYSYHIAKPIVAAAGTLKHYLNTLGVTNDNHVQEGNLKNADKFQPKLITEIQRPIEDIISPLLKNSDNYLAENIFKLIGAQSGKLKDNGKEAKQIISNLLDSLKLNCTECQINDGSGLSRRNKVTSESIVNYLEKVYTNKKIKPVVDSCLSIAGVDGTLKSRMKGTLAENNLHAKTGTHGNVSALAGVVRSLDGELIAFSFIFNGSNVGLYKQIENQIGIALSEFFFYNREF